ncbi:hypothetical protein EAI_06822 [Harpegnathos saltator]|uniref:Uncharacterized protein n=1 Tax=Harpegnathos saltator TaxID=610380 RepID=E2BLY8_HARSA|nr:hypothetical protein EAI_06822 [Harpegnathos saltator]
MGAKEAGVIQPPPPTDKVGPAVGGASAAPTVPDPPPAERPEGVSEAEAKMEVEASVSLLAEAWWEEWGAMSTSSSPHPLPHPRPMGSAGAVVASQC